MNKLIRRALIVIIIINIAGICGCARKDNLNVTGSTVENIGPAAPEEGGSAENNIDSIPDPYPLNAYQFENGYYHYGGVINGNFPIQMILYLQGTDLVGSYYRGTDEIKLKGKSSDNQINLNEYDSAGKNTGVFQGTMETVYDISGTWTSSDGKTNYPFTVSLDRVSTVEDTDREYSLAYEKSHTDVDIFAEKIKEDIISADKQKLAEKISFPINVKIDGKLTEVSKSDFLKNYDRIINPAFKMTMQNAFPKYMFANWMGIMFGGNTYNVWINDMEQDDGSYQLMITALNN